MAFLSSTVVIFVWFYPSKETSAPFAIALFTCVPSKPCRETGSTVTSHSDTEQEEGAANSRWTLFPLLEGRSTGHLGNSVGLVSHSSFQLTSWH